MAEKILVIDDDPFLRDIYEMTLRDAGYDVEISVDGEDALNKLHQGGYALCLLDMMLPKIDGIGVLSGLIKTPPLQKNGPIIVLSNLSHEPVIKDALAKGAASFLVKAEMTPDVLLAEVKKHIASENSPTEPPKTQT